MPIITSNGDLGIYKKKSSGLYSIRFISGGTCAIFLRHNHEFILPGDFYIGKGDHNDVTTFPLRCICKFGGAIGEKQNKIGVIVDPVLAVF